MSALLLPPLVVFVILVILTVFFLHLTLTLEGRAKQNLSLIEERRRSRIPDAQGIIQRQVIPATTSSVFKHAFHCLKALIPIKSVNHHHPLSVGEMEVLTE